LGKRSTRVLQRHICECFQPQDQGCTRPFACRWTGSESRLGSGVGLGGGKAPRPVSTPPTHLNSPTPSLSGPSPVLTRPLGCKCGVSLARHRWRATIWEGWWCCLCWQRRLLRLPCWHLLAASTWGRCGYPYGRGAAAAAGALPSRFFAIILSWLRCHGVAVGCVLCCDWLATAAAAAAAVSAAA